MVTSFSNPRQEIDQIKANFYNNTNADRAFAHWALKCILADVDPSDDDLRRATAIGSAGDLGLDAYWIDEDNSRIILVQAKDTDNPDKTQRIRNTVAQAFRSAIESLANEDYIRANSNSVLREAYHEKICDRIFDDTYSIYGVLAAGGQIRPNSGARIYCEGPGSSSWLIEDGNSIHSKDVRLELLDIHELQEIANYLRLGGSTDYVLPVVETERGPAFHYMGGTTRSALATVHAQSLADAYSKYHSRIFQHNPRGAQASNKVNSQIFEALHDPTWRKMFHILNNGITVVCESISFDEETHRLAIEDLQIVNGCQTVYTLYRAAREQELPEDVTVNIRVVEGLRNVAAKIAKASNSQTAVKAEQLASLDSVHEEIQRTLDQYDPPWYYEKQLGAVRLLSEADKRTHRSRYGSNKSRTVTITELGDTATAFLGHPILAKHARSHMFEKIGDWASVYDTIFSASNSAAQLILPVTLGRRIEQAIRARVAELRAIDSGEDGEPAATELDWLPSAQHHVIGLIGFALRDDAKADGFPSDSQSLMLLNTVDDWFENAFHNACDAIQFYVEMDAGTPGHVFNIRQFFRNEDFYSKMQTRIQQLRSRHLR